MKSKKCKESEKVILQCQYESCDFKTKLQPYLNKHIRTVHEKLPCVTCGKLVPKSRMKTHMTIFHTENSQKPFNCEFCGKGFATRVTFQEHTNIHTGERPYKCDFENCNKTFASSGNMYMHRRSSHLGKFFVEIFFFLKASYIYFIFLPFHFIDRLQTLKMKFPDCFLERACKCVIRRFIRS